MTTASFKAHATTRLKERVMPGVCGLMMAVCALLALNLAFAVGMWLLIGYAPLQAGNWEWTLGSQRFRLDVAAAASIPHSATIACPLLTQEPCVVVIERSPEPDAIGAILENAGVALLLAPIAVLVFGLAEACRCFFNLARGRYFDRVTVGAFRTFALSGLVFAFFYFYRFPILVFAAAAADGAIRWAHPGSAARHVIAGQPNMAFSSYGDLASPVLVVYALSLTVMAAVMARAAAVAEDNAQIV